MPETSSLLTAESRRDLDSLLAIILPFAQQMLRKQGGFFPFGASMDQQGKINLNAAYDGDERPHPQTLMDMLVKGFQMEARELRAIGICQDVRVLPAGGPEKVDAIEAILEHSCKVCIHVFTPYRKGLFRRYRYGRTFASEGDVRVFK